MIKADLETNWKFSAKSNRKKFQSKTWNTVRKKSFQQRRQLYLWIRRSERKAASSFNRLCLNNTGALGQRQVRISKSSTFFPGFAGRKHSLGMRTATNERMPEQAPFLSQSTIISVYEEKIQMTAVTNLENGPIVFQK